MPSRLVIGRTRTYPWPDESQLDEAGAQKLQKLVSLWQEYATQQKIFYALCAEIFQGLFHIKKQLKLGPGLLSQARRFWLQTKPDLAEPAAFGPLESALNKYEAKLVGMASSYPIKDMSPADGRRLWDQLARYLAAGGRVNAR